MTTPSPAQGPPTGRSSPVRGAGSAGPQRSRLLDLLALGLLLGLVVVAGAPRGDLANYHVAARLLLEGADLGLLYDYRWFTEQAARVGYEDRLVGFAVLTPPSALLLAPVALLEPAALARLWQVVQAVLVVLTTGLLAASVRRPPWQVAAVWVALLPALHAHLVQGQVHLLAVLLVALGGWAWGLAPGARPDGVRQGLAGGALGLAVGLKVHAWPLLVLALLARQWGIVGAAVGTLAVGAAVSVALLGLPLHETWLREIVPAAAAGMFGDPWHLAYQSLGHALRHGVLAHPGLNPLPPLPEATALLALPRVALAWIVGLSVLPGLQWERLSARERAGTLAAASVAALVGGPLLARYHLLLLAPALAWVAATLPPRRAVLPLLLALLATGLPAPVGRDLGGAFMLGVPRFWLCLALWAVLLPWPVLLRPYGLRRATAAVLVGGAALALVPSPAAPDDGARPADHPYLPLVMGELALTGRGALLVSGLVEDRRGHAGQGWVGVEWDPDLGPPEIVVTSPGAHVFGPRPDGGFTFGPTGQPRSDVVAGPDGGRLWEEDGDIWWGGPDGARVQVTTHPGHDDWPVWDAQRGRIWFLSDRGVGVRALRIWSIAWQEGR